MPEKMIVNAADLEQIRIAILRDGALEDFDIETRGTEKNKGNVYKAVVAAVEPSLNAAFIDYGSEKHGFLTVQDIDPAAVGADPSRKNYRVSDLLKPKQTILVQVDKDEVGSKGAVLTTHLSLAGRYLVLMPGGDRTGVSRKISDEDERKRMRATIEKLAVPEGMGVILRTAGKDRTKTDLSRDLKMLTRMWDNIRKESNHAKGPALIFKEQDVIIRALRDYFSSDIDEVVVDSDEAFDRAEEYMRMVMPRQRQVLTRYVERPPIFHHYGVEDQLASLFSRKVPLGTGGSIVVDPTEALVAIDVNSGKQKSSRQADTALLTNLQAAVEVARQLRLRDLGGIIVIDFIDMVSRKHEREVEKALREALKQDKARVKVGRISPNGTLELTRQRIRTSLGQSVFETCAVCSGTGHVLSSESHALAVLRALRNRAAKGDLLRATAQVESEAGHALRTNKWQAIQDIESMYGIAVTIVVEKSFAPGQHELSFETDPEAVAIELPPPDFGPAPSYNDYEDDDDFDQEDDDEMTAAEESNDDSGSETSDRAPRKKRSRRSRRRKPGDEAVASREKDDDSPLGSFDMPSFEFVDPKELERQSQPRRERSADGEAPRKRRRRRRPSDARKPREGTRTGRKSDRASARSKAPDQAKPTLMGRIAKMFRIGGR